MQSKASLLQLTVLRGERKTNVGWWSSFKTKLKVVQHSYIQTPTNNPRIRLFLESHWQHFTLSTAASWTTNVKSTSITMRCCRLALGNPSQKSASEAGSLPSSYKVICSDHSYNFCTLPGAKVSITEKKMCMTYKYTALHHTQVFANKGQNGFLIDTCVYTMLYQHDACATLHTLHNQLGTNSSIPHLH